jgi:AraC-like DNA-binding protein
MHFERVRPRKSLDSIVEWFWLAQFNGTKPKQQKIIPDGFPELVFHFGDPYRILLDGKWRKQGRTLLGGQMRKFFFLENTGRVDILGITLKPTAPTGLFGLRMRDCCDKVINLSSLPGSWQELHAKLEHIQNWKSRITVAEEALSTLTYKRPPEAFERSLRRMHDEHGTIPIGMICSIAGINERQLQRLFMRYIGLSPKYYARVIRFSHIFSLLKSGDVTWSDVVHASGYYDQSHFIRDFTAFAGEDPTTFRLREGDITTFFAGKSREDMSGLSNTSAISTSILPSKRL